MCILLHVSLNTCKKVDQSFVHKQMNPRCVSTGWPVAEHMDCLHWKVMHVILLKAIIKPLYRWSNPKADGTYFTISLATQADSGCSGE